MKTIAKVVVIALTVGLAAGGCGKKDETSKEKEKDKTEKGTETKARASRTAPAPRKAALTLAPVKDAGFGYEITIPKGSKTLAKSGMAHTYSYPLPGGMHEYNVHITKASTGSLAKLVRLATMMGSKQIEEKKKLEGGGFLVVKKARGVFQQVWVSKKGGKKSVTVKCSGPAKAKAVLVKICTSLKVTP